MEKQRVLTGITTSGTPHLGNYAGAIRPAIAASHRGDIDSFYFLADYHALVKVQDPARVQRSTLEIAATWLAAGLDPNTVWFYRQSDIPEIPELTWLLTCVAGKGLLNRAHAYKAAVDRNTADGLDPDAGINAGLFMYPVLMAADILLFKANKVPVGRDQVQHLEMARDFALRFNHIYGQHFVLPEVVIDEAVATLPGLDGRKMSKSYDNTIPLFAPPKQLRALIQSIVTDSRAPGEPKQVEGSALFQLYQAFADPEQTEAMRQAFADGIAWGEAKAALYGLIDSQVAPMREKYEALLAQPIELEAVLREGANKASKLARPFIAELREAVGLRNLHDAGRPVGTKVSAKPTGQAASFKQYREGALFHFKLVDGQGKVLLTSAGHVAARDVGQLVARLRASGGAGLRDMAGAGLYFGDQLLGMLATDTPVDAVVAVLAALAAADATS
ncbi:tryptophan--tRNA ligase [soil metagenome]